MGCSIDSIHVNTPTLSKKSCQVLEEKKLLWLHRTRDLERREGNLVISQEKIFPYLGLQRWVQRLIGCRWHYNC